MTHRMITTAFLLTLSTAFSLASQRTGGRVIAGRVQLYELRGTAATLQDPVALESSGKALVVLDFGDNSVKAFSASGKLVAKNGRAGGGPGEYRRPSDIEVAPDSTIAIADPAAGRVTWTGPDGTFLRSTPLKKWAQRVTPLGGDSLAVYNAGDSALVLYDGERRIGAVRLPPARAFLDTLTVGHDRRVARLHTGLLLLAFVYSGEFAVLGPSDSILRFFPGVSPGSWPQEVVRPGRGPNGEKATLRSLPPDAPRLIREVVVIADTVLVLSGPVAGGRRFLDHYSAAGGRLTYRCSVAVEDRLYDIAILGDQLFGLVLEPEPMLVRVGTAEAPAWRPGRC